MFDILKLQAAKSLLERLLACEIYVYGIDSDLHVRDGRRHATGTADKIIDAIKSSTSRTSLWEAFSCFAG